MKKYIKFISILVFSYSIIFIGAKGKLLGTDMAKGLFEMIGLFGKPEHIGRILVGSAELFAGIAVFIRPIRKIGALVGSIVMIGAMYFHATTLGMESSLPALVTLLLGIYITVTSPCMLKKKPKITKEHSK